MNNRACQLKPPGNGSGCQSYVLGSLPSLLVRIRAAFTATYSLLPAAIWPPPPSPRADLLSGVSGRVEVSQLAASQDKPSGAENGDRADRLDSRAQVDGHGLQSSPAVFSDAPVVSVEH